MRPQKPSSTTRVALLGVGALALVASVGGSASSASSVEAATVAVGGEVALPTGSTGAQAIRAVDFGAVAQPGSACTAGLRFTPPGSIPVAEGSSQVLDLAQLTQLTVDPAVGYGDLDGDGAEEAVVHVTCTYGANGAEDSVHVWSLDGDRLSHVAALDEPVDDATTGGLPPAVEGVDVAGGEITVTWSRYAEGDPNCCPSEQVRLRYALDGGTLRAVGEPVTSETRS